MAFVGSIGVIIYCVFVSSLALKVDAHPITEQDFQLSGRGDGTRGSIYQTRFDNVTWDNDNWVLATTNLDQGHYQSRMSVANGYLGINVAALGPFFEVDSPVNGDDIGGWPLYNRRQTFATISGFYDLQPTTNGTNFEWLNQYGGESVISGVPHWSGLILDLGNSTYLDAGANSTEVTNFSSSLDMKSGVMSWNYTWTPAGEDVSFDVYFSMFAHKLFVTQAIVQLQVVASRDYELSVVDVLNGDCAVRTQFVDKGLEGRSIYTAVRPDGIDNVTAVIYSTVTGSAELDLTGASLTGDRPYVGTNTSSIAQAIPLSLKAGQAATVTKFVGGASSDGFEFPKDVAKNASLTALSNGYDVSLRTHKAEWSVIMPVDSVDNYSVPDTGKLPDDDNIVEAQITTVTSSYYLLQNTVGNNSLVAVGNAPINTNSISVGGLGSDAYAGFIFWDAEIWMQPGLAASYPFAAKQIANYRVKLYDQALENAQTSYTSSKNDTTFSANAAVFPWTSGRFGNCTGTGPCFDYEYHINGDILMEMENYWVTSGDTVFFEEKLFPIFDSVATFYSQVIQKNGTNWTLTNMTDPDEYANHVDNGGYTMALIADVLEDTNDFRALFNKSQNSTWESQAANVLIPRATSAEVTLEYTGANNSITVKQADVILNIYPLAHTTNYTEEDALNDLDYYAGKQSINGPGMTYSVFSIASSEVSQSGCSSWTYQLDSSQPYARAPWFQLSEQLEDDYSTNGGTHPAYPFLTGHGGTLQVALFGYLGLRLEPSFRLIIDPSLPPQIPHLRYRTFYFHGWPISAVANQTHTTVSRPGNIAPLDTANQTFADHAITVQRSLTTQSNSTYYTTFSLQPNGSIVFPNSVAPQTLTVAHNLLQCHPVLSSTTDHESGQFPLGAIDGATSTKWQPSSSNASFLTVDLEETPFQRITGLYFDWAQSPPETFSVYLSNSSISSLDATNVATHLLTQNVTISNPYDIVTATSTEITSYSSNETNVTFPESSTIYSGRYATLVVEGNLNDATQGATVAEFALLGQGNGVSKRSVFDVSEAKRSLASRKVGRWEWKGLRKGMAQRMSPRLQSKTYE